MASHPGAFLFSVLRIACLISISGNTILKLEWHIFHSNNNSQEGLKLKKEGNLQNPHPHPPTHIQKGKEKRVRNENAERKCLKEEESHSIQMLHLVVVLEINKLKKISQL